MKIVFLEATQNLGGARLSTIELATRLMENNEVHYIDLYGSCIDFMDLCNKNNINLHIIDKRKEPFIIAAPTKIKYINNVLKFFPHYFSVRKKLYELLAEINPDYILVNDYKILSFLLNHKFNAKIVMFARGWGLKKQFDYKSRLIIRKTVDRFACVSQSTRQAIYNNGMADLKNIFVVHDAVEENLLSIDISEIKGDNQTFKIHHSGGFLPDKGLHISIEIARKLRDMNFNFHLVITGILYKGFMSDNYHNRIIKMIKDYQLQEYVTLVVNKPNVISYFRACDVLIHPSSTEGLPRVALEAMILKKPVIANAVGGITDIVVNNFTGIITNFNDIDDYVNGILKFANDRVYYDKITNNAYDLLKSEYTKENQLVDLQKCLNYE